MYIYIYIHTSCRYVFVCSFTCIMYKHAPYRSTGYNTVGNPHRSQMYQFELFELIISLALYKRFSIEQFEPTVYTIRYMI